MGCASRKRTLCLVIAKAVQGQLAAGVPKADLVRQVALFGAQDRDGWSVGLTILTALANLLPALSEEDAYLAIFHGARRVAADCDGQPPRRERAPLKSRPEPATPKRWLRRWTKVRHREAAERTLLTAIAGGLSPAVLADALLAAETERAFADDGHSLDFHQQGVRMPGPDWLGACFRSSADRRRPDGGGLGRRGIDRMATACRSGRALRRSGWPNAGAVRGKPPRAWLVGTCGARRGVAWRRSGRDHRSDQGGGPRMRRSR